MPQSDPPLSLHKTVQTFRRNLLLTFRLHPHRRRLLLLLLFLPLLFFVRLTFPRSPTRVTHAGVSFIPTTCACPPPSSAPIFTATVLATARFVARVRHIHSTSSTHHFVIATLFRSALPSARFPLSVPDANLRACLPRSAHRRSADWLLVADHAVASSQPNISEPIGLSLLAEGCSSHLNVVWLIPWHSLSTDVAAVLSRDDGDANNWWRARNAWLEFSPSAKRAMAISRGVHIRVNSPSATPAEWWLRPGISIIAACQDRTDSLLQTLPSWLGAANVDELVLVDWSSHDKLADALPRSALNDPRLVLLRVDGQSEWMLSRAYNLALRFTTRRTILKVDCDTRLSHDFLNVHPLPRNAFYAGDWTQLNAGASNALHTNGVLFVARDDLFALGGYDERITTYGWDDSDLATRLSRVRTSRILRYEKLRHLPHAAGLRVRNQRVHSILPPHNRLSAAVEIQRNRLLATKFNLPLWRARSLHTQWNVRVDPVPSGSVAQRFTVTAGNDVSPISALVSERDALDVAKRAIRLILHRYDVPLLPKTLSLDFYKHLADKVALPEQYAEVVVSYRGGGLARLLAHINCELATSPPVQTRKNEGGANALARVVPPQSFVGWRLRGLWRSPEPECSCLSTNIFEATDEEILSGWHDTANKLLPIAEATAPLPDMGVTELLNSFAVNAIQKNVSAEQMKWFGDANGTTADIPSSRVLFGSISCDGKSKTANDALRLLKRQALRELTPARSVVDGVTSSLHNPMDFVLDSKLLSSHSQQDVLGGLFVESIDTIFNSSDILSMAARWSGSPLLQPGSGLAIRAANLVTASRLSRVIAGGKGRVAVEVSAKVEEVQKIVYPLFKGCALSSSEYLQLYPELAVIAAALISSGACM